ncbi:MAG: hypothetical protein JST59_13395 [Actinobacteria bacterium]|nr:hypothetical protein [Actinomycetota bacterium]
MVEPMHKRENEWRGEQPFGSPEEFIGLTESLIDLIDKAARTVDAPEVEMSIDYPGKSYGQISFDEFKELAPALSIEDVSAQISVEPGGWPPPARVSMAIWNRRPLRPSLSVSVTGKNEVAVNGLFVAVVDRVNGLYERKRRAEELAIEKAESEAASPASRWRRIAYNPYTVAIVAGLIVLFVGIVIGLIIGSN